MAGGGSLGGDRGGHQKRGSLAPKKRKKKRVGFVLDMTPLVDIAFLLLTFFMLSTTMNTPQVMEMQIPPQTDPIDVPMSQLMNLIIRDDGKLFYSLGTDPYQPLAMKDLGEFAVNQNMRVKNKLITALKVSGQAQYGVVVDVLDALNIAEGKITDQLKTEGMKRERKFALVPPTPEELEQVKAL